MNTPSQKIYVTLKIILIAILNITGLAQDLPDNHLDMSGWFSAGSPFDLVENGSVLDVSYLIEKPAGQRGFVTVSGDRFIFEDGTEARFWGGNMTGGACFPDHDEAERIARKLAQLGVNLVRLHHIDVTKPWGYKNRQYSVFGGKLPNSTRKLDSTNMARLDYLIYCLKKNGIYIFLSHQSNRLLAPEDGFPGGPEALADVAVGFKGEGYFDPFLKELHKELTENLLIHVNPYTGLALKDDPVLAMMEITNENYLYPFYPHSNWFQITSQHYRNMLSNEFNKWLLNKYGTHENLILHWQQEDLSQKENLNVRKIDLPLSKNAQAYQTLSSAKRSDIFQFLTDLQSEYNNEMYEFVRSLGVKIPITPTAQFKGLPVISYLNSHYDFTDVHGYWKHPTREYKYVKGQEFIASSMLKDREVGIIGKFNQYRVAGKPYTLSEWNECLPNPYRGEGLALVGAYATYQNWHPMHFNFYGRRMEGLDTINAFEALVDPAFLNLYPAVSILYHQRHVSEAKNPYTQRVPVKEVIGWNQHLPLTALAGLTRKTGITFTDSVLQEKLTLPDDTLKTPYYSDNGQLKWDTQAGLLCINSPSTQAIIGFSGGQRIETDDVVFLPENKFSCLFVTALDERPIAKSQRILITASADAQKKGVKLNKRGTQLATTGTFPFLVEPVSASIILKSYQLPKVYAIDTLGRRTIQIPAKPITEGMFKIELSPGNQVAHYEVRYK